MTDSFCILSLPDACIDHNIKQQQTDKGHIFLCVGNQPEGKKDVRILCACDCILSSFTIVTFARSWPRLLACAMRSLAIVITIVFSPSFTFDPLRGNSRVRNNF